MDRDTADEAFGLLISTKPELAKTPALPVVISICTTCKTTDGSPPTAPEMFAAMQAAVGDGDPHVLVRQVQCLGVCKRPATAAVSSSDGYTFLFGDLQVDSGAAALLSFVQAYRRSDYGLVPWRERADVLRKGMLARVPPLRWSPGDGSAPK